MPEVNEYFKTVFQSDLFAYVALRRRYVLHMTSGTKPSWFSHEKLGLVCEAIQHWE